MVSEQTGRGRRSDSHDARCGRNRRMRNCLLSRRIQPLSQPTRRRFPQTLRRSQSSHHRFQNQEIHCRLPATHYHLQETRCRHRSIRCLRQILHCHRHEIRCRLPTLHYRRRSIRHRAYRLHRPLLQHHPAHRGHRHRCLDSQASEIWNEPAHRRNGARGVSSGDGHRRVAITFQKQVEFLAGLQWASESAEQPLHFVASVVMARASSREAARPGRSSRSSSGGNHLRRM